MVRAHQSVQVTAGLCANHRPSVAANIVKRMDRSVVASDDDNGVGIDLEREIVPWLRYLAGVPGWLFAGHTCEISQPGDYSTHPIDNGVGIDLEREIVPWLRYLAGVPGKEPAGSPDTFNVQAVHLGLAIKLTRQRPTRTARGEP